MSIPNQIGAKSSIPASLLRNQALLCSLALVVCTLISRPFVEMGIDDDWSYIRSALHVAQTGKIAYYGWSTPILGCQLYLGALFIRLFGFSFSVVRFSVLLFAAVTVYLLHRILVRCGIGETYATLGTLTFCLSPLFLPLSFSFMTDVPGLFSLLLCLYLCLRSLQTASDTSAFNWLVLAAVSNVVSGSVRQTAWLGLLVIVPSAGWLLRNRRLPWVKLAVLWLFSLLCIYACIRWFGRQPFTQRETPIQDLLGFRSIAIMIRDLSFFVLCIPMFLLPVLMAFVTPVWVRTRRTRIAIAIALAGVAVMVLALYVYLLQYHHPLQGWLAPWGGTRVTDQGLINFPEIGVRPSAIDPVVRAMISLVVLAGAATCLACIFGAPSLRPSGGTPRSRYRVLSSREVAFLFGPFTAIYLAVLLPRNAVISLSQRYLLPLLVVVLVVVLRQYRQKVNTPHPPVVSLACLLVVACYSVAAMHDFCAMQRARLTAASEIIAAGVPRTGFYGGFDYDSWNQVEISGFVMSPNINLPAGIHPMPPGNPGSAPCGVWYGDMLPAIHPSYAVSFDQLACQGPSLFAPIKYRTWLPPYTGTFYIQTVAARASAMPSGVEQDARASQ